MARLTALILAGVGATVLAEFPNNAWAPGNAAEKRFVEKYFDLAKTNNGSISTTRLYSVPDIEDFKDDDRWPYLLQLNDDSNKFFVSASESNAIFHELFAGQEGNYTFQPFDQRTVQVYLNKKDVEVAKNDFNAWKNNKEYKVNQLVILPYAARIDPLATVAPSGVVQVYCLSMLGPWNSDGVCGGSVDPGKSVNPADVDTEWGNDLLPKIPVECTMPEQGCPPTTYVLKDWCEGCKSFTVSGYENRRGINRVTISGRFSSYELETLQLLLAADPAVAYVSTTPDVQPLLSTAVRSVQGGGVSGYCDMLWRHDLQGQDYTVGLVDMGIDQTSTFFVDESDPTPCGDKPQICGGRTVTQEAYQPDNKISVDGNDYYYQPDARKIKSYVVAEGANAATASDHGTTVASVINGEASLDSGFAQCSAQAQENVGMAPGAQISLYDIGGYNAETKEQYLVTPDEDYTKMFEVSYSLDAHDFVVPFGANSQGRYTPLASDLDLFMHEHQDTVVVAAAGNGGHIASAAVSKNALAVGAVGAAFTAPADFNSKGPTHAGLIKPDVIAPGSSVKTAEAHSSDGLGHCDMHKASGTSVSAGLVGAASVLVRQYFEKGFYPSGEKTGADTFSPHAATIKAVLVNSARQQPLYITQNGKKCPTTDKAGYGNVRLDRALTFKDNEYQTLSVSEEHVSSSACNADGCHDGSDQEVYRREFKVEDPTKPVSATLAWIDPPAANGARHKVVQSLHLEILSSDGGVFTPASPPDCHQVDHAHTVRTTQNTQKVVILLPTKGSTYTVKVTKRFVYGEQKFSVVVDAGTIETEDQKYLVCCPADAFAIGNLGCYYVEYILLTVVCSLIGVAIVAFLVLACINARKAKREREEADAEKENNKKITPV